MSIHFATKTERANWNTLIQANSDGGNIFQGFEFGEQKRLGGWMPRHIVDGHVTILALEKSVPLLGRIWYLPKGPGVTSTRQLDTLLPDLKEFAKAHGVFLMKIEPELLQADETVADLLKLGLLKAKPIQPNVSTVLLDLSDDLDTVMRNLNQKGRHAIKRAERDGVVIKRMPSTDKNCQLMYRLLAETANDSHFRIRSYQYYQTFWQRYAKAKQGQLFFAYVDGQIVAAAYAMTFDTKSIYKDGASVRERPVYGASHLLQWHVIEWAKSKGSTLHDLCGTPPADKIHDTDHPLYGIGRFKTSFNKTVTDYIGVYDAPLSRKKYKLWLKFGERAVVSLHNRRFHENYY